MTTSQPQKRLRKKKKSPKKFRLSYSLLLLFTMVAVGIITGVVSYGFGKQALEEVNPAPAGIKLPNTIPVSKPKENSKPSPQSRADSATPLFLDESEVIATIKVQSQQELGGLTRPNIQANTKISDRKKVYTKVDQAFNSMRDPLAISANADQRIAERIAELRQRVYASDRSYETTVARSSFVRPMDSQVTRDVSTLTSPSDSFSRKWQDRDVNMPNTRQVNVEVLEVNPNSVNSVEFSNPKAPASTDTKTRF
ncbi:hypothetical protein HCU40_00615 [Pseudanabaena biceps]|nr:hypothetical protein [Pseudanabaena biceps]